IVEADGTLVRAVGTAFGVEQRAQGVVVTVAEGKIAVLHEPSATPAPGSSGLTFWPEAGTSGGADPLSGAPEDRVILTADQQIAVPRIGRIGAVKKVDSQRELAWAEGRLVFENEPIGHVVERFNQYNRVRLVVTDDALARRTISGVFDASDPE